MKARLYEFHMNFKADYLLDSLYHLYNLITLKLTTKQTKRLHEVLPWTLHPACLAPRLLVASANSAALSRNHTLTHSRDL